VAATCISYDGEITENDLTATISLKTIQKDNSFDPHYMLNVTTLWLLKKYRVYDVPKKDVQYSDDLIEIFAAYTILHALYIVLYVVFYIISIILDIKQFVFTLKNLTNKTLIYQTSSTLRHVSPYLFR